MMTRLLMALVALGLGLSVRAADLRFTYDDAGRLIAADLGGGAVITYAYDPNGNLVAHRTTPATPVAKTTVLAIASEIVGGSPMAGRPFTLRLRVSNNGTAEARETRVSQLLPAGFRLVDARPSQGFLISRLNPVLIDLGTLALQATATVDLILEGAQPGNILLQSTVTSPVDPAPGGATAILSPNFASSVDLVMSAGAGPHPLTLGSPLVHTFVIRNVSSTVASQVTLVHTHPASATFLSGAASQGTTSAGSGQVTANLGVLAAGASATVTIRMAPTTGGTYSSQTTVTAAEPDTNSADNTVALATPVEAPTLVVSNTNDDGLGSLRQALLDANANPDRDIIAFQIPTAGQIPTIALLADLPFVVHPVVMDGFTQAEGRVELTGSDERSLLTIQGGRSALRSLVLNRGRFFGLVLEEGGNNVVEGCFIGTGPDGISSRPNAASGIRIRDGSGGNRIGGPETWQRNVIGTNDGFGISISESQGNRVEGNFIGLGADGTTPLGNDGPGVVLNDTTADAIVGNVISGNDGPGVSVSFNAFDTRILGNRIGTDAEGQLARPNLGDGVSIGQSAIGISIGGSSTGEGNLISGNVGDGIENFSPGVRILGNFIGTDLAGSARLPNSEHGVELQFATGAVVGGSVPGEGNLISGNLRHGIELVLGSNGNRILGNTIGTDLAGAAARSNGLHGVTVVGSSGFNVIGGLAPGEGNLISGNGLDALSFSSTASDNRIIGNFLGTDRTGTSSVGNRLGISTFQFARRTHIEGNLISGNRGFGVQLTQSIGPGATLVRNLVGTDVTGLRALPNASDGVAAFNSPSHIIGPGNILSGNGGDGLSLNRTNTTNTVVIGNWIGLAAVGLSPLGNATNGVTVFDASANRLGGPSSGDGNVIAANGGHGIQVFPDPARPDLTLGVAMLGNLVFANGGQGIELGGTAPGVGDGSDTNDAGDTDSGPNRRQNHPVLAVPSSASITASLQSSPFTVFRIEFFGQAPGPVAFTPTVFLGSGQVTTDAAGFAQLEFPPQHLQCG
jgi:YD repeat-containing protein